jgi:hypothetical protein
LTVTMLFDSCLHALPAVCVLFFGMQELPGHVVDGLTIHFASTYKDVYDVAFGDGSA